MPVDALADQKADIRTGFRLMPVAGSRQFAEQRLRLPQIGRVEAFGEPAINRLEKIAGFGVALAASGALNFPGEATHDVAARRHRRGPYQHCSAQP
jgi:hypothetical protein